MLLRSLLLAACALLFATVGAQAKGYLASRPEALPDLVLGIDDTGFGISQKEYNVETGKSYRLKIISTGAEEYAIVAPRFFDLIWLRKVEAGGMEIKANAIYELEFEKESEAEIFFVPIKPGKYEMYAKGLKERGVLVTINVK